MDPATSLPHLLNRNHTWHQAVGGTVGTNSYLHSSLLRLLAVNKKTPGRVCEATDESRRRESRLGLVRRAGRRRLVVAAVHFLLHGDVFLQLLAGVVGDLQEAAGLHDHVGLAGVWQDGVLGDDLRA